MADQNCPTDGKPCGWAMKCENGKVYCIPVSWHTRCARIEEQGLTPRKSTEE